MVARSRGGAYFAAPDRIFTRKEVRFESGLGARRELGGRESKRNMRPEGIRAPEEDRMGKRVSGARASAGRSRNSSQENKGQPRMKRVVFVKTG